MDFLPILRALTKSKVGALLIGLQVALTLAIVCNSLSVIQQFTQRMQRPTGIDEANIFTISTAWIADQPDLEAQIRGDLAALRGLPGVVDSFFAISFPLDNGGYSLPLSVKTDQRTPSAVPAIYYTDDHGLATFGLKLIAGRWFHADEVGLLRYYENKTPAVIVVTEALAKTLFPAGNALGQIVYFNPRESSRIIGVIEEAQTPWASNGAQTEQSMFLPALPLGKSTQYVVRARPGQLAAVMHAVQDKLLALDSHRVIQAVTPFSESRHAAYLLPRTMAVMLAVVSALMLAVTGFGVVGLTAFWVAQRRPHIGMRRALGARRVDILAYFQTENLLIAGVGCILGIALGLAMNTGLAASFEMNRMSLGYICLGALIVLVLCQGAVLWPALRAASIPPATATRAQ
ncbi:MAG TPA: FtsX-like permease family protein [Steroidobacteraceae bacterium]|nr:FtsX-like permease family protein [Steroidobacteraceae bacterium]